MTDYYAILQVHPKAEPEVIKAAYRVLAHKYHPDHGGDAAKMAVLNDAWDVLGDPARRAAYDASRSASPGAPSVAATRPHSQASSQASGTYSASPRATPWSSSAGSADAHAGPPPGHPSGTVLDFGRYSGWSLGEIARYDVDYLEWLQRATFGRRLRTEIEQILRQRRGGSSGSSQAWNRRG